MNAISRRFFTLAAGAMTAAAVTACSTSDSASSMSAKSVSDFTGVTFLGKGVWTKADSAEVWLITAG